MGMEDHSRWTARARLMNSGSEAGGVFAKRSRISPVAGLMEGMVSRGMAVAAIVGILNDFGGWVLEATASQRVEGQPQQAVAGKNKLGAPRVASCRDGAQQCCGPTGG